MNAVIADPTLGELIIQAIEAAAIAVAAVGLAAGIALAVVALLGGFEKEKHP